MDSESAREALEAQKIDFSEKIEKLSNIDNSDKNKLINDLEAKVRELQHNLTQEV